MKYQVGDVVAFDIPIRKQPGEPFWKVGARTNSQRFDLGTIKALDHAKESYVIVGLHGGEYIVPEDQIGGTSVPLQQLSSPVDSALHFTSELSKRFRKQHG